MSREYPCVHHNKGLCAKFTEPGYVSHCVFGPCSHELPSNADRIRAMSDEELAAFMSQVNDIDSPIPFCKDLPECLELLDTENGIPVKNCEKCMLDWLRQPATENVN